jgi:RsiW-degrading membrane proteinase PrsW (M82 family)
MQQAITGYKIASWELYMGVGIVEEGAKLFILKRETWDSPYFETRYDGILYAVFVSLGFAAFENVKYVMAYGLSVAVTRALLAIPAHMAFAVLMGMFYGRAKQASCRRKHALATFFGILCYVVPVLLHGAYDSMASVETLPFIIIVIIIYFIIFKLMRREALADRFV